MILDMLKNSWIYESLHPAFPKAFEFLAGCTSDTPAGRVELDGNKLFALVQEYDTKAEGSFETHKKYIDIQFILSGTEIIGWTDLGSLNQDAPYNSEKDITFYNEPSHSTDLLMTPGSFSILYPEDGHKPGMTAAEVCPVKKVVMKILL